MPDYYYGLDYNVSNGDYTYLDTSSADSRPINVLDAEIRWRGDRVQTGTETVQRTEGNYYDFSGPAESESTKFFYDTTFEFPDAQFGTTFTEHEIDIYAFTDPSDSVYGTDWKVNFRNNWDAPFGTNSPGKTWYTENEGTHASIYTETSTTNYEGTSFTVSVWNITGDDSMAGTIDEVMDLSINLKTHSTEEQGIYDQTQDPSVSGGVSASHAGTVNNNDYTPWYNLSGFSEGNNLFNHSIGGSGSVDYQVRFTYEIALPEVLAELGIQSNGTAKMYAIVDPSDGALEYSEIRVQHPTHGECSLDVVDANHQSASNIRFSHPVHGELALRERSDI